MLADLSEAYRRVSSADQLCAVLHSSDPETLMTFIELQQQSPSKCDSDCSAPLKFLLQMSDEEECI